MTSDERTLITQQLEAIQIQKKITEHIRHEASDSQIQSRSKSSPEKH